MSPPLNEPFVVPEFGIESALLNGHETEREPGTEFAKLGLLAVSGELVPETDESRSETASAKRDGDGDDDVTCDGEKTRSPSGCGK